jgi:acetoin utilization protein AcuB
MAAKKKRTTTRKTAAAQPKPRKALRAKKAAVRESVPTVSRFMTKSVHTIGRDQPLSIAHQLMNKHSIRHLPVLEHGKLVGLVSQRDLYFVEALATGGPDHISVEEAMSQDVFEVAPSTPLSEVLRSMVRTKHGSVVVTQRGAVAGVFTAIDGLEALLEYLPA